MSLKLFLCSPPEATRNEFFDFSVFLKNFKYMDVMFCIKTDKLQNWPTPHPAFYFRCESMNENTGSTNFGHIWKTVCRTVFKKYVTIVLEKNQLKIILLSVSR